MTEKDQPLTKEYVIQRLRFFRDEYSDDIPEKVIHSTASNNRFKVRRGWFAGMSADLSNALDEGVIDPTLAEKVNEFLDWVYDDFGKKPGTTRTTKEDIEKANEIIDIVLKSFNS